MLLKSVFPYQRPLERYITQVCGGTTTVSDLWLAWRYLFSLQICEGPSIALYEQAFAEWVGVRYAYCFGAGRVALYAILQSLAIKEGDEVILPGYTCVVVPQAIRYCGAKPVYADISLTTYNLNVAELEQKITPRTRAVIVQHTYGIPADIREIVEWAHSKNLVVIEDCAHALGTIIDGHQAGSFGDAAFYSSEHSKVISTGRGGVAVTNNSVLSEKLRLIQSRCQTPDPKVIRKIITEFILFGILGNPSLLFFGYLAIAGLRRLMRVPKSTTEQEMAGDKPANYKVRLSNAQAAIGLSQLRNLEANLSHRRALAQFYAAQLLPLGGAYESAMSHLAIVRYPLQVPDKESLVQQGRSFGIELGVWFTSPIHPAGSSLQAAHYEPSSCPNAERAVRHTVNLPTHPKITLGDAERIVEFVRFTLGPKK